MPCGVLALLLARVFCVLRSEVFAVLLRSFGSGSVVVSFSFSWRSSVGEVRVCCRTRRDAARVLLRFRAARRVMAAFWWSSGGAQVWDLAGVCLPFSSRARCVVADRQPLFGLRWLACRSVVVRVFALSPRRWLPLFAPSFVLSLPAPYVGRLRPARGSGFSRY